VLAAAAAIVVAEGPGGSATAWISRLSSTQLGVAIGALVGVTVIAGFPAFAVALLRNHGRLLVRVDALEAALAGAGLPVPRPALRANRSSGSGATSGLPIGTALQSLRSMTSTVCG